MKTSSLITVALLAFVVVAVGFLIVKEIRTSEGIASLDIHEPPLCCPTGVC